MLSPTVELGIERELTLMDVVAVKNLGKGAFGKVYKVQSKATNRDYALKEIAKSMIKETGMEKQVINEIKIMYSLDHENIVKLFNHFEDEKCCYLLMEYAPGVDSA